jgi:hypothetical protein
MCVNARFCIVFAQILHDRTFFIYHQRLGIYQYRFVISLFAQIILKDLRKILTSLGDRLLDSEVTTLLSVLGDGDTAATAPPPLRSPSLSISPPSSSDSAAGESSGSDGPSGGATVVDTEPEVVCNAYLYFNAVSM